MRKQNQVVFLSCVLWFTATFTACTEKAPPLPFKTFQVVLKELHLAEAAATVPGTSFYTAFATDSSARYNAQVLKNNGLTEGQFRDALAWYKDHPELLDSAYRMILTDLTVMQSDINK